LLLSDLTLPASTGVAPVEDPSVIKAAPQPSCLLCGVAGSPLYPGQTDRLFGSKGRWNSKRCDDPNCNLIWLDPMPLPEEIGKAYKQYYTHSLPSGHRSRSPLKALFHAATDSYMRSKFGYLSKGVTFSQRSLGTLMYLLPVTRRGCEVGVRFLDAVPGGRLLDVGCGAGDWLLRMRDLGWQAQGMDFDPGAVAEARRAGLDVRLGSLEEQDYSGQSFDAITLNHVIEHLPDPIGTLKHCFKLLKPGGKLVVVTPNGSSLGHHFFKANWRGLEIPRHLFVFSHGSLKKALERAGFETVTVYPQIARSLIQESIGLSAKGEQPLSKKERDARGRVVTNLLMLLELCAVTLNPRHSECSAAVAIRPI
jgi:2-polyprenyl-3-methyl-5-hydroxy-6-metoxy-1,4-benzoquinol methylase